MVGAPGGRDQRTAAQIGRRLRLSPGTRTCEVRLIDMAVLSEHPVVYTGSCPFLRRASAPSLATPSARWASSTFSCDIGSSRSAAASRASPDQDLLANDSPGGDLTRTARSLQNRLHFSRSRRRSGCASLPRDGVCTNHSTYYGGKAKTAGRRRSTVGSRAAAGQGAPAAADAERDWAEARAARDRLLARPPGLRGAAHLGGVRPREVGRAPDLRARPLACAAPLRSQHSLAAAGARRPPPRPR